jgi:hypothetical protein
VSPRRRSALASGRLRRRSPPRAGRRRARVRRTACAATRGLRAFTFTHKPLVWPAGGGEPDPIEHTDDNIARPGIRTAFPRPGPGRRSASRESPATGRCRGRTSCYTTHAGQHLPRSADAVPGQDAGRRPSNRSRAATRAGPARRPRSPGPITVWAALNTSRCRMRAESAGRADRRLMVEPRRKRRHAKLRKANRTSRSARPSVRPTATAKPTRTAVRAATLTQRWSRWVRGCWAASRCSASSRSDPTILAPVTIERNDAHCLQ